MRTAKAYIRLSRRIGKHRPLLLENAHDVLYLFLQRVTRVHVRTTQRVLIVMMVVLPVYARLPSLDSSVKNQVSSHALYL